MFKREKSKKTQNLEQNKSGRPQSKEKKEDSVNPLNLQLFDLSPLSPIMRTVKKSFQFSSPQCDLAMINTPLGMNKQKSLIEEVDEESHHKISMVLGFEEANEADEIDNESSSYESQQYEASESEHEPLAMEQKIPENNNFSQVLVRQAEKLMPNLEEEIKLVQKIQKRKLKPASKVKKVTCNCKRTKCLKLYCDCFRQGGYCDQNCNCSGCHNTQQYESQRNISILSLLQRNPEAFKPKVEAEQHSKGCNCKKSGCLKKYCECYQAGLVCGEHCKCEECKNCGDNYRNKGATVEQQIPKKAKQRS